MGRAIFQKSTNRPIEYQGSPRPGTLLRNAVVAGFDSSDTEEREISFADYLVLLPAPVRAPTLTLEALTELLVERNVVSRQDIDGKKR